MTPVACLVDGCERRGRTRGYCPMHDQRIRKTGSPGEAAPRNVIDGRSKGPCSVEGCDRAGRKKLGLCEMHYARAKRLGDPGSARPLHIIGQYGPTCSIDGCAKPRHSRGYCGMHYRRWRISGDLGDALTTRPRFNKKIAEAAVGETRVNRDGYVTVRLALGDPRAKKNGWALEHRVVMSEILGRPLAPNEEVHHKNANRSDNRPGNLELWAIGRQPPGARVGDLLAWAHQIIADYGPLEHHQI